MTSIDLLRAVHHPIRRRILDHLRVVDAAQVGDLARVLDQQVGSISHHLRMLERVGVVERAPELATDGRTSWWRAVAGSIGWAVDDFEGRTADLVAARAAERLTVDHQLARLSAWRRGAEAHDPAWRRAAFSSDGVGRATPSELADLAQRLTETVRGWQAEIGSRDDDEPREPVFWFAHGFPMLP